MNYRHAYHAGNIGDVLKHAVLARLIVYFQRKDKAFRILDTHAGIGLYDLTSEETRKTGEWQHGIAKVLEADMPAAVAELLEPWLGVVRDLNPGNDLEVYPGSPQVARQLLRKTDRLTLTELHPQDFKTLSDRYAGDHQVKTIHLDGWLAMGSFLPPKEKRGLVLIDPAFEVTDEFVRMTDAVLKAYKKWPGGTYALWYPLKDARAIRRMHADFEAAGLRDVLALELNAGKSGPDTRMLGSGMTLVNAPFTLADEMRHILPWLADVLHQGPGAGFTVTQLIVE
ncbi:23S rRNA (adenine(2030)-N(6))-methyltransferase RlmJ [Roseibium sediminicola]|uniref:Ribosomal RNA large subunit methyltransferase J n=1 Tax=Roseibium sediminicola TaxID=2933272 RepID=A0ABT0GT41_9HYPH|nr:23S rRNA (adenine(2030)-N(6))-methyltransferase RlmJ [Roseibium sp. CAU 1639]MCK7612603.1 23S rRNA (adenine(2030)-N(6))-methyltransferase RlmJ [Roseibium sp. CAU 1639]